jgi:hypothetical protein
MSNRAGTARSLPGVLPTMPPRWVFWLFNPIARFLLAAGVPPGFNGLITIRGGLDQRAPQVAMVVVACAAWHADSLRDPSFH